MPKLTAEQMLAAMKPKPKVIEEIKEEEVIPEQLEEEPILPEILKEVKLVETQAPPLVDTTFSHRDSKKEPTTNELLISAIANQRRMISLLEQLRQIALGQPLSEYNTGEKNDS